MKPVMPVRNPPPLLAARSKSVPLSVKLRAVMIVGSNAEVELEGGQPRGVGNRYRNGEDIANMDGVGARRQHRSGAAAEVLGSARVPERKAVSTRAKRPIML